MICRVHKWNLTHQKGPFKLRLSAYPVGFLSPKLHKAWALQKPHTATPYHSTKWGQASNFSTLEDNTSIIKPCWVTELDHSPVSQSAKYFKIIGPGKKKKENKNMVTSLLPRGCSQGKSENDYKFNFCVNSLYRQRDRIFYQLGL